MTSSFEDQNKLYSQLKAYSEKQLSSTPIITVRVEGAITEAGEVLAIFPQVFRFPAMPSFLSQSLTSHEVLSRCACDDILNLLSLNSPGWANQLVTSSHKQHSSLFIHNCLCRWFLFGGISFRISSQGDIFPSEFIGNRIFGYKWYLHVAYRSCDSHGGRPLSISNIWLNQPLVILISFLLQLY